MTLMLLLLALRRCKQSLTLKYEARQRGHYV